MKNKNNTYVLLSIKVSKENEKGPLAAEQMFANLHGVLRKASRGKECESSQEYYSLEIVNIFQNVHFFAYIPAYLKEFFQAQVYAQYSDVEINEREDYVHFREYKSIASCELEFIKHDILPINSYIEFEDSKLKQALDPLSSITESIKNTAQTAGENIGVQMLFKPIHTKPWQSRSFEAVGRLQKGKNIFLFGNEKKLYTDLGIIQQLLLSPLQPLDKIIRHFSHSNLDSFNRSTLSAFDIGGDEKTTKAVTMMNMNELTNQAIIEKAAKLGYRVVVRITYWSDVVMDKMILGQKVLSVANSFKQFNHAFFNGFDVGEVKYGMESLALYKTRKFKSEGMILNTNEAASLFHLPNQMVKTPNIVWVTSRKVEPPVNLPTFNNTAEADLTIIGKTNFRKTSVTFGMMPDDRRRHVYIIGKTGMGKSTLIENMVFSDIVNGRGVGVIDPHGELADSVLEFVPEYRKEDVIVIDPSDVAFPVAINMLEDVPTSEGRSLISSALVGIFKKMFADSWGPRLEHVLRNTILALIEAPDTNMMGIMRILVDEEYRNGILSHVTDPVVLSFWNTEFANYAPRNVAEIISPIQNKVGQFLSSPIIRNIVGQTKNTINIREAMDSKKIIIVNLSKGKIGEDNSALLGSMMVTRFQLDAMSRAHIDPKDRVDFYLYVDEFQNFATDSFATILSEARKYKLNLTMANQYIEQMSEEVRGAVFGNVGTIACFQVGYDDAMVFENQFGEVVLASDITALEKYTIYLRLLVDGMPSQSFSAVTLPPPDIQIKEGHVDEIINMSRKKYSQNRDKVEEIIHEWSKTQKMDVSQTEKKKKGPPQISIDTLQVGQQIKANVIGVTDYGLFLSYQGIEGLLHINKIPQDQKSLLQTSEKGDLLEVNILEKKENGKLAYSLLSVEDVKKVDEQVKMQRESISGK